MASVSDADVEDLMYAHVSEALAEMASEHRAQVEGDAAAKAEREAKRARREEAAAHAEAAHNHFLCTTPLEEVTGKGGPGSNGLAKKTTLESKQDRKRKAREAMTQEQRDQEDEEKARRVQKAQETKARNKAQKERKEREANEPPKKVLRPIEEIEEAIRVAGNALNDARHEATVNGNADMLPVSLAKLAQDVVDLEEELRATKEELNARAIQAGADEFDDDYVPFGRLWWPKGKWLPADLKIADEKDVRYVNIQAKHHLNKLEAKGEKGTDEYNCVTKTWQEMRAELRRRLEDTQEFKAEAKKKARETKITALRQKAIDDFDNWEKHLKTKGDIEWRYERGQHEAYYKRYGTSMPDGAEEKQAPPEPELLMPILPADVATEEL